MQRIRHVRSKDGKSVPYLLVQAVENKQTSHIDNNNRVLGFWLDDNSLLGLSDSMAAHKDASGDVRMRRRGGKYLPCLLQPPQ